MNLVIGGCLGCLAVAHAWQSNVWLAGVLLALSVVYLVDAAGDLAAPHKTSKPD